MFKHFQNKTTVWISIRKYHSNGKAALKRAHGSPKHPKKLTGRPSQYPTPVSTATVCHEAVLELNGVVRTPPCSLLRFGGPEQLQACGEPVGRDSRRVFTAQPVTSHIFGRVSGEHLLLLVSSERLWLLQDTHAQYLTHSLLSLAAG